MNRKILFLLLIITQTIGFGQNKLEQLSSSTSIEEASILESLPDVINSDVIFYGFIHGAEMSQQVEAKLLIELMEKGVKYYAPEVSYSGAYFLNKYLQTGNEDFLFFVLDSYIARQDASIQWIEKYRSVYNYLLKNNKSLTIIGTDITLNGNLIISHLSHLLASKKTGNLMLDSLQLYRSFEPSRPIISGAPVTKIMETYGLSWVEVLYPKESHYRFTERFIEYYENNKSTVLETLRKDSLEVKKIVAQILDDRGSRESYIFENFQNTVLPLIEQGEKVYSNFGFSHVLQGKLNNRLYIAGMLKDSFPNLKVYSILTHLADSEVYKYKKYCKTGKLSKYGKTIKLATICGTTISDKWDGDSKKEKVKGIEELKTLTKMGEINIIPIKSLPTAMRNQRYFIDYEAGKNPAKMEFEKDLTTSDYFQGLIFIRGSKANETWELIKK